MAVSDTLIGSLFDRRYRIQRKLGSGGMADVYLAEDQELGRRVAIKILNDRHANDEQFVERFRREAKNAAALSHPNIVSIYDRGEAEGTYYIAMEYSDGRTLKELILSRGPAPIPVAIDYARQILSALRFAHRNGIVHRDIKPHNVLVDTEGRLKVTDFGIARAGASQMTEAGSIVGTAQYLSPEQAKGTAVDQRSDLYSVGVVLYELLTGNVPFTGDAPVEIAMKHLSTRADPPSKQRPDVPRDLDLVVTRALAKDPAERYASAEEMDADLERVQRGLAVSAATEESATQILRRPAVAMPTMATVVTPPPAGRGYRPPPAPPVYYDVEEPPPSRQLWPWLLAVLVLAAAGVGAWFLYHAVSNQIAANRPVRVDIYTGMRVELARARVRQDGLVPRVIRQPSTKEPVGIVFNQSPPAGEKTNRGNAVTLYVSTGVPKSEVPDVVGQKATDAVGTLKDAHLQPRIASEVFSDKADGTVLTQDPPAHVKVKQGTVVDLKVSKGTKPIEIPDVRGQPADNAISALQAIGLDPQTSKVDSNAPENTVIDQNPAAGTTVAKGTVVTLTISKGPQTTAIPDVSGEDRDQASSDLQASGFRVHVVPQDTSDPTQDGIVLGQSPQGGTQATPKTTVTLTVGRLVQQPPPPPPPPPPTPPPPPPPTDTTTTDTTTITTP